MKTSGVGSIYEGTQYSPGLSQSGEKHLAALAVTASLLYTFQGPHSVLEQGLRVQQITAGTSATLLWQAPFLLTPILWILLQGPVNLCLGPSLAMAVLLAQVWGRQGS